MCNVFQEIILLYGLPVCYVFRIPDSFPVASYHLRSQIEGIMVRPSFPSAFRRHCLARKITDGYESVLHQPASWAAFQHELRAMCLRDIYNFIDYFCFSGVSAALSALMSPLPMRWDTTLASAMTVRIIESFSSFTEVWTDYHLSSFIWLTWVPSR